MNIRKDRIVFDKHIFAFIITVPNFVKELRNVSVAFGRDATIDCEVSNAGNYKVIEFLILIPLGNNIVGIKIYSVQITKNLTGCMDFCSDSVHISSQ